MSIQSIKHLPFSPASPSTGNLIMGLLLGPESFFTKEIKEIIEEVHNSFSYKVLNARLNSAKEHFGLSYDICDEQVKFLIAAADFVSTPANLVQYTHALYLEGKEFSDTTIDLEKFCFMFATGFPNQEELSKHWNTTKNLTLSDGTSVDNGLDHFELW